MKCSKSWMQSRSRLLTIAVLTALAVVATGSEAFAQALPGENNTYNHETVGGDQREYLALQGSFSEARNGGNLLEVWRGATNNQVWMSFNNGPVFTIGETQTYVSPAVVPWGQNDFLVFHTGVDGNIYYSAVYSDGSTFGQWYQVPGNTTNMPVSLAQMGTASENIYMVYRGVGNDQRVWGTWVGPNGWALPENIDGGLSITAPSVVYNPTSNQLTVAVQGLDNNLYITAQALGAQGWLTWQSQGIATYDTPHMAVNSDGQTVISILTGNAQPKFAIYDPSGGLLLGWDGDTTGWQSPYSVQLTAAGPIVYSLLTGFDGLGYWKQLFDPGP